MKKVIILTVLATWLVVLASCEKEPQVVPPPTFKVNLIKIGDGSINVDKTTGITAGSTVNFKIIPGQKSSIYSIKINGKSINAIIPFDSEYNYSYLGINADLNAEITFVKTDLLILSVQEPAWKWTKMDYYRVNDDSFAGSYSLAKEQSSRRFYFLYPSMILKLLNPDGSVYGQDKWDLKDGIYTQWGDNTLIFVSLTPEKFKFKTKPFWSEWDNCYIYAVYTYERVVE